MIQRAVILTCLWFTAIQGHGERTIPALSNGVISYVAEDGQQKTIRVGKKCSDLWISPDENIIAFIAIEKEEPPWDGEIGPFITQSNIYVGWKKDHFKPVRINLKPILVDGRYWKV